MIRNLGFEVIPTEFMGTSPFEVEFKVFGGLNLINYKIEFGDGQEEEGKFIQEGEYMVAYPKHVFEYTKGKKKYYSHSFYPRISVTGINTDGAEETNVFNEPATDDSGNPTGGAGISLAIIVFDPKYKPE